MVKQPNGQTAEWSNIRILKPTNGQTAKRSNTRMAKPLDARLAAGPPAGPALTVGPSPRGPAADLTGGQRLVKAVKV